MAGVATAVNPPSVGTVVGEDFDMVRIVARVEADEAEMDDVEEP